MPVFNGARFLPEALTSILAQTYGDFELLISDNASTDATRDICADFAAKDSRIRYDRLPENMGAAYNYNRLVPMARGELFKWAAHDDRLHRKFLARCVEVHAALREPPSIVYPQSEFIDARGTVIGRDRDMMSATSKLPWVRAFQALQSMNMTSPIAGVFHKSTLQKTRLIGSFVSSDYVLLLEAALLGSIIQLDGEPLFQRRIHEDMSRQANTATEDVVRWFDPKARSDAHPQLKLYAEYLRAPLYLPELSPLDRFACDGAIALGVAFRRTRVLAGRYRKQWTKTVSDRIVQE